MVVREAVGFAEPGPEDTVREDELSVVPVIELQLSEGFRPVVIERWLRVYGDSLRRIAETETDWWHSEVVTPLLASGMTEVEMLEAQADLGSQMAPLREQALLAIYHGQQEHTWTQVVVEHVESALEAAGLHSRVDRLLSWARSACTADPRHATGGFPSSHPAGHPSPRMRGWLYRAGPHD
jgi:adenylate cyclase